MLSIMIFHCLFLTIKMVEQERPISCVVGRHLTNLASYILIMCSQKKSGYLFDLQWQLKVFACFMFLLAITDEFLNEWMNHTHLSLNDQKAKNEEYKVCSQ